MTLSFNEQITAGTGNIVISTRQGDTHTIDIHDISQVSLLGSILTITLTENYLPNTEYSVLLDNGIVTDTAGNAFVGITDSTSLVFTTFARDTTPPLPISAYLYLDAQGLASLNPSLTLKFDEPVKPGTGNFIISNGQNDVRKITGSDSSQVRIGISDSYGKFPPDHTLLVMTPTKPLLEDSQYFVLMEVGAVTDIAGNAINAVLDPQALTFKTIPPDTTPPELYYYDPADDSFIPPYTQSFTLHFNEDIKKGSGHIIISNGREDVRTFNVNDSTHVQFDYQSVTIKTEKPLIVGDTYFIQIEPGALIDAKGNAFTGITDTQRHNFFIKADTEVPQLISSYPVSYEAISAGSDNSFISLNFNESILIGSGNITLLNDQGDKRVISVRDTTQVISAERHLTIKPANPFLPGSVYRVLIDKGVVTDLAGNEYEGINDPTRLVFKILPNE